MFSTPLFAADDDHAQILKELLIDHLSEKELKVCGWVVDDAYPYTLQKFPNNYFYAVVGSDGRCEYGHGSDEESAFNNCEKWKKEKSIPGTCKPFAIGKEIVWGKEVEVKIDIYENMDAIKEFCEITKICIEDFFSTYLKAEEHKAIAVVRKLGSENEYFLNLDGWHTGASSREIANTKALEQCEEKKIGFKDLQDYENYECKIIIYNNAIINENYVAWAEKLLLKSNWEESIKNTGKSSVVSNKSGCIQGNCENGQGTFIWDNGDQYVGAWKDGKPHGEGTFDWRNRTKFVGEWRDGKKHGYGAHSFQDGSNHIGKWKNGKKHGWVMTTGGNMGIQVYEWKDGVRGEWLGNLNWEYVFNDNPYADGNIITNKDPTTLQNLVFVEEKLMETFDRRFKSTQLIKRRIIHGKMNVANHFVFKATFENDHKVTVAVNAEFKTKGKAEKTALKYIKIVGQLPTFLREGIYFIVIHKGKANWGGGARKIYIHTGDLNHKFNEETMVHEAGHAALDWNGLGLVNHAEWGAMQLADKKFISEYAQQYPDQEDVAETILWWIAVRCKPDKISKKNYKKVLEAIPNRLKYFDEQNYDTYPLVCNF